MVLGNDNMKKLTIALSTILIASCAHADLSLSSSSEGCTVRLPGAEARLDLTPPCKMMKNEVKNSDYYEYGEKKVYIIAGEPASADQLEKWSVEPSDHCSLQMQAAVVMDDSIKISELKEGTLACPELGLDEKVYRGFTLSQ